MPRTVAKPLTLAVFGLVLLVLVLIAFDPVAYLRDAAQTAAIRRELPRAVQRWKALGFESYRIRVRGALPMTCFVDGELVVTDGRVTEAWQRLNPLIPETALTPVDLEAVGPMGCPYDELTVEGMFARIERDLSGAGALGAPLTVSFDPEWGYVTEYRLGRASRGGLLEPTVSECCSWFELSVLPASSP